MLVKMAQYCKAEMSCRYPAHNTKSQSLLQSPVESRTRIEAAKARKKNATGCRYRQRCHRKRSPIERQKKSNIRTHAMRLLSMLNHHDQLLPSNKAPEARIVRLIIPDNLRISARPSDILRLRKQFFHQRILRTHLHFHITIAQARVPTIVAGPPVLIYNGLCIARGKEFNKAIHRFCSGPIHDDVYRAPKVWRDDLSIAAEMRQYLGLGDCVRDLLSVSVR